MFELLESIVKFLGGLLDDLLNIINTIGNFIGYVFRIMDYFIPVELAVLAAALFAVIITYKIIGREG